MTKQAILITRDHTEAELLATPLNIAGLTTRRVTTLEEALRTWPEQPADLIMVGLDSEEPLPVVEQVRAVDPDVPLILLGEFLPEPQRAGLLATGADLVLIRPYPTQEMVGLVIALLRRGERVPVEVLSTLRIGERNVDPTTREVRVGNRAVARLTSQEFRLLFALFNNRGRMLSHEELITCVWGDSGGGSKEEVRDLARRVRAKLGEKHPNYRYILNVRGSGYVFASEPSDETTDAASTSRGAYR